MKTRYNKVMENINVDDAMRERILTNLSQMELKKQAESNNWSHILKILSVCFVLVIGIGLFRVAYPGNSNTQVVPDIVSYETKAELEKALDIVIDEDLDLPMVVTMTTYAKYWDLAEIEYSGSDMKATYRISKCDCNVSGDYETYQDTMNISFKGTTVTVKGNEGLYSLAEWQSGDYSYSLKLSESVNLDIWENIFR